MWSSLSFSDGASSLMEQLIFFHDYSMMILMVVFTSVTYSFIVMGASWFIDHNLLEEHLVEVIWTIMPAVLLVMIGLPSLRILYLLDEVSSPSLTLKVVGHQWYWSYEYSDFLDLEFDSYMLPSDSSLDQFRLLDVDNRTVLPMGVMTRVLVTSADVIHSWTVPSLGVKADALPGRLNQLSLMINRPGLYPGQCSEICGANHSFMPIMVESVMSTDFLDWAVSQYT